MGSEKMKTVKTMQTSIILLLLLVPSLQLMSQYHRKINPEIVILNVQSNHIKKIKKGMSIGYISVKNTEYTMGDIDSISHDTIFINNSFVRIKELAVITDPFDINPDSINLPENYEADGIYYRNDTTRWKIYSLPGTVSTSYKTHVAAYKAIKSDMRKEGQKRNFMPIQPNYLMGNLTRLMILDFAVTYERKLTKSVALGVEVGYKFGVDQGPTEFVSLYPFPQTGPSLIIGPKFYFRKKFYFSPLYHIKYLEIHESYYVHPFISSYPKYMDQYEFLSGISLRLGIMANISKCWLDFHAGGGVKFISAHEIWYYYYNNAAYYYYPPKTHDFYAWQPILNFGVKIGGGF